jgi:hypothetical protein
LKLDGSTLAWSHDLSRYGSGVTISMFIRAYRPYLPLEASSHQLLKRESRYKYTTF